MAIQLLNDSFDVSTKIKKILLACYTTYALKYPNRNQSHIKKAVKRTLACRTEASGCRVYKCPVHPVFRIVPHSCGHRFCTICSSFKTAQWVNQKVPFMTSINTPYLFLTFTVLGPISRIIQENKKLLLGDMFHAVADDLLHWCQKHRNFTPGMVLILQTSGDRLNYHVHIHLLFTCGGLREEKEWIKLKPKKRKKPRNGKKFHPAIPPETIEKGFKNLINRALRRAYKTEGFFIPPEYLSSASTYKDFNRLLDKWWDIHWHIDISDPLKSTKEIIEYIARYTKKPPISNRRIIEFDEEQWIVRFSAKDRNSKDKRKREPVTMSADYFVMSLLEHVPLEHFPMIRWYGIFSNRNKKRLMPIVQQLIPVSKPKKETSKGKEKLPKKASDIWRELHKEKYGVDPLTCPICGRELEFIASFFPKQLVIMGLCFEMVPQFLMN